VKYFELEDDMRIRGRWLLHNPIDGNGQELWHGQFFDGLELSIQLPLRIDMFDRGQALDFSTNAFGVPVIHGRVKAVFEQSGLQDQMQLFPISVEGQSDPYFLMNLLRVIRCIDDERCKEVAYRTVEEGYESRIGEYRKVVDMRIDPSKVGGVEIFRPWGWQTTLIVSERVRSAMEEAGVTGAFFTEV